MSKGFDKLDDYNVVRKWSDNQLFTGIFLTSRPDTQAMFIEFSKRNVPEEIIDKLLDEFK